MWLEYYGSLRTSFTLFTGFVPFTERSLLYDFILFIFTAFVFISVAVLRQAIRRSGSDVRRGSCHFFCIRFSVAFTNFKGRRYRLGLLHNIYRRVGVARFVAINVGFIIRTLTTLIRSWFFPCRIIVTCRFECVRWNGGILFRAGVTIWWSRLCTKRNISWTTVRISVGCIVEILVFGWPRQARWF